MPTDYVLIDFENVQPKSLAALNGHALKVKVFVGANQTKVPMDLVKTLQPMGENAEYVMISGQGRNALDFHVAFYLGELSAKDPAGCFYVISKDAGFDPLIAHTKSRGIFAQRYVDVGEIPVRGSSAPKSREQRVEAVMRDLANRRSARPRRVATLLSTINALFAKSLPQGDLEEIVAALEKRGAIVVTDGRVSYSLD
jgi:hypothetical protein